MALVLSDALRDAQDSQSRHPIVEVLSKPTVPDIPFDGQFLDIEEEDEKRPNTITHSSGRICLIYNVITLLGQDLLRYAYSDVNRMQFTFVDLSVPSTRLPLEAWICELSNGDIGIIYITTFGTDYELYYKIISVTGSVVVDSTLIATYTLDYPIESPSVIRLANGTYLLVYTKTDTGNYKIIKRTSSDFQTWSAESEIAPTGLEADHAKYNTSLIQITTGDVFLWFDYVTTYGPALEEMTNIYYSISADNGATWGTVVEVTGYDSYSTIGKHPIAVQKAANQMHLLFNEVSSAIYMDGNTLGWCGTPDHGIGNLHFDSVNRKIYLVSSYTSSGMKALRCVVKVDLDTWTIDDCWNFESVPAFNSIFGEHHVWWLRCRGDENYVAISVIDDNLPIAAVLDATANTITMFNFVSSSTYGLTQNVTWTPAGTNPSIFWSWINATEKRIYFVINTMSSPYTLQIGWIDLTAPGPQYTFNQIVLEESLSGTQQAGLRPPEGGDFLYVPSYSYFILSSGFENVSGTWKGLLRIYDSVGGGEIQSIDVDSNPGFPYHGLRNICFIGGKIYGTFQYEADYGEAEKRGLCELNLGTGGVIYHRPSWATLDDYGLHEMVVTGDGRIIMICHPGGSEYDGITIFNPADNTWELLSSDSLRGLQNDQFVSLAYDDTSRLILAGSGTWGAWDGLTAFLDEGFIQKGWYKIGNYSGGNWSFGTANSLVQGLIDFDVVAALDPVDKSMFAFWDSERTLELSIKWDKENSQFDLTPYLVRGSEVELNRSIDGTPTNLAFTVSHGHLFDTHNIGSLWSIYLKKFRKITLRFGEKISGTDVWQQQAVVFVVENQVSYERPQYPTMKVKAEDQFTKWEFANVIASDSYSAYPESILSSLVIAFGGMALDDINIPTFDDRVTLYHQWIECNLKDVLTQICERFGYYPRMDVDGKFTARKISDSAVVDHSYSNLTKIMNFTPDDSFSDWTNQILVKGESRDWIEVLYAEESVGQYSGSMGWWGKKRRVTVPYSPDYSRRCRYPRFEVRESVKDGPYFCKDGDEYMGTIDSNEKYFIIIVEGPDLVGALVGNVIAWLIVAIVCAILNGFNYGIGILCSIAAAYLMYNIMQVLGTQGFYQYEAFARPVGYVRQSFQGKWDDEETQTEVGVVVSKSVEDPLCYAISHCQFVANFEGMVVSSQRKRVMFAKLADLRDEDGDTIRIPHPYTSTLMKIFITNLRRIFRIPSSPGSGDGSFTDEIEGWHVG